MTGFTRGFKLHLRDGQVLDGAAFPSGRAVIVDDPEYGLASAATSVEELLKGYHRARIEWADDALQQRIETLEHVAAGNKRHIQLIVPKLEAAVDLLKRTEGHLSALHGSVGRHDNLAANLACGGCELRDAIRVALADLTR
jgi:lipopolysaccharide biosynthesis regulator YciM